jgi:DNA polymerase-3 subunit gamma/tau
MASQSLYRKWRSQTFSDLIGQEPVTRTLLNAVREGRLAHAYLFCGPRGIGKTSVARLLAKAINCQNPQNGEPCNECVSCQEITSGRSPDVIEIDAATNNGIDNIRDIRDNANLIGSGGRYKVYVVDECHMLSTAAFNALLKTLEEPPPHVIFVLATTEAHKVLPTVVSRCQRFDFRRFSMHDIVGRLEHVARGEGLALEPAAAELLARTAQGGMRDALSLLDQAVAFCGARIDIERTRAMLGLADVTALRRLIACVADDRPADGLEIINELVATGADLRQLNSQLAEEWRALMLARAGGDLTRLMEFTTEEARDLAALAERFSLEQLMACARVFTRNEGPARGLPVPQLALELSFLECVSVRRGVAAGVSAPAQIAAPAPVAPAPRPQPQQPPSPRAATPATSAAPRPQPAHMVEELDLAAIDAGTWTGPVAASAPQIARPASAMDFAPDEDEPVEATAAPTLAHSVGQEGRQDWVEEARRQWPLIRKVCKQKAGLGSTVYGLLNDAEPVRLEPGSPPTLIMAARHDFHLKSLREDPKREIVEWALEQALGTPFRARFVSAGEAQPGMTSIPARRASAPSRTVDPAPSSPVREDSGVYRAAPLSSPPERATNGPAPRPVAPTPAQPGATPAPSERMIAPTDLDQVVKQDPVVLEFVRHGLEVAEVRPLDPEGGSGQER